MKNHVNDWIDGKISAGKLLELHGVPKQAGQELLGELWQAMQGRLGELETDLRAMIYQCDRDNIEAQKNGWKDSVTAEAARKRALVEVKARIQFHFGDVLARTGAGR
jgi:hypothetical protein